ncbi:MAG: M28 family metallopeptidase [Isosphaeraceae bacterium]
MIARKHWGIVCLVASAIWTSGAAPGPIVGKRMLDHIKVLASDEFEGRGPGTKGEDRTVAYLIEQFQRIGLEPGNPDGTFVQEVPLVGFQTKVTGAFRTGDKTIPLNSPEEWVAVSRRFVPDVTIKDSDVVFVGYGVVAPEFGWDDYKDLDVRGKTIVMLVNDPPVPDPDDPEKLDPKVFQGQAMTYYGRWTYKYEIASAKGAAAAVLVHETGPAGYPFEVVSGSWGRENFDIPAADGNKDRVGIESWITLDTAKRLCALGGQDFDALKQQALRRDFRPTPLNARADFTASNTLREIKSKNVIGKLNGSDLDLKNEFIIYTAHWDHLGRDESLDGDQIFNGAADNASGVAMMLEIAEGFQAQPDPPKRSILFLAVTAEEKGLLGAKWYAGHPLYPLEKTLANINMDVVNLWGRTRDVTSVGLGLSTLDDILIDAAKAQGRTVQADPEPEKGLYYRSDHFEFAKVGVPALNAKGGSEYIGKPADYGRQKRDEYTRRDYHKVSDEVKPDWDLSGAVEDAELLLEVGDRVAGAATYPEWKPGAEFKARRDAMLRKTGP